MVILGHTARLEKIDGLRTLSTNPQEWGSLLAKAEYLNQFQPVKAWQVEIQPEQLATHTLEQLAEAITVLSTHKLFSEIEWFSLKFPLAHSSQDKTLDIAQESWRPFFLLLQVLNRFQGSATKNLSFQITRDQTLPNLWRLSRKHELESKIKLWETEVADTLKTAYYYRDHLNKEIQLTFENNQPYLMETHSYPTVGLFPVTLKRWQLSGVESGLNIAHAALACWYREQYGHDGPFPSLNTHHRTTIVDYWNLDPKYIKVSGLMNTQESFTHKVPIGSHRDDIDWELWLDNLSAKKAHRMPLLIDLVSTHKPDQWPLCQASAVYLKRFM